MRPIFFGTVLIFLVSVGSSFTYDEGKSDADSYVEDHEIEYGRAAEEDREEKALVDEETSTTYEETSTTSRPYPRVMKTHDFFEVAEGRRLSMPCNIEVGDGPSTLFWAKGDVNGERLFLAGDPFYDYQKENNTLIIKHVNASTTGLYSCVVSNNIVTTHFVKLLPRSGRRLQSDAGHNYPCILLLALLVISLRLW